MSTQIDRTLKREFRLWSSFAFAFAFISPIVALYGIFGWIFTAIACLLYNWVAGFAGGVEIRLEAVPVPTVPPSPVVTAPPAPPPAEPPAAG